MIIDSDASLPEIVDDRSILKCHITKHKNSMRIPLKRRCIIDKCVIVKPVASVASTSRCRS